MDEKERTLKEFEKRLWKRGIIIVVAISISIFLYINFLKPTIIVWQEGKIGEAELARGKYNRQIKISEAQAHQESAKALAEAEIIRARGVAEANKIIGESLKENEQYLRYLWVNNLHDASKQVIYVPTEANLPLLEANRLKE